MQHDIPTSDSLCLLCEVLIDAKTSKKAIKSLLKAADETVLDALHKLLLNIEEEKISKLTDALKKKAQKFKRQQIVQNWKAIRQHMNSLDNNAAQTSTPQITKISVSQSSNQPL